MRNSDFQIVSPQVVEGLRVAARGQPVTVRLPGGRLDVTIGDDGRTTMRGPARRVFSGVTG